MGMPTEEMFICPLCSAIIGVPVHPLTSRLPDTGDTVLCAKCGKVLIVAENHSLRRLTLDEVVELISDDDYLAGLKAAEQAIHAPGSVEVRYHAWREGLRKIEE